MLSGCCALRIFGRINIVNSSLQARDATVFDFVDVLGAFLDNLNLWDVNVSEGHFDMFDSLDERAQHCQVEVSMKCHLIYPVSMAHQR